MAPFSLSTRHLAMYLLESWPSARIVEIYNDDPNGWYRAERATNPNGLVFVLPESFARWIVNGD